MQAEAAASIARANAERSITQRDKATVEGELSRTRQQLAEALSMRFASPLSKAHGGSAEFEEIASVGKMEALQRQMASLKTELQAAAGSKAQVCTSTSTCMRVLCAPMCVRARVSL